MWAPCRAETSSRSPSWNSKCTAGLGPTYLWDLFLFSDHDLPWQPCSSKQWICQQTGKMLLRGGDDFCSSSMWTTALLPWRDKNKLTNFSANLIFPAEHPSIISSNTAKFYKIIKLFSQQAEKTQRGMLHTPRCIHTDIALSNIKHFAITLHESTQEHIETKQHSCSVISGRGLDVLYRIKCVMKYSQRYLMLLPLASMHCQKELISWYMA